MASGSEPLIIGWVIHQMYQWITMTGYLFWPSMMFSLWEMGLWELSSPESLTNTWKGFYRSTYVVGGEKKSMAVTQFEAVEARRCFPCWDEPALKASFKMTAEVPSELTALSNMPDFDEKLNGHLKTVHFQGTPIMSTYLVAFVVGLFDYIEDTTTDGIKVRVYCPIGKSDKGKFVLDVALRALDLYTKYFSMPYALPKLDMVAVPDFATGAMENYGLVVYREVELLHDDLHSTAANKQMKIWSHFLGQTTEGLRIDALEESHPIEVEMHHARSVEEFFDAIGYKKGSAVIRMLQHYLGDDTFQAHWDFILNKWGSGGLLAHFIRDIVTLFCSNDKADEVEAFFATHADPSIEMNLKQRIKQIRNKARWVQSWQNEQSLSELIWSLAGRE